MCGRRTFVAFVYDLTLRSNPRALKSEIFQMLKARLLRRALSFGMMAEDAASDRGRCAVPWLPRSAGRDGFSSNSPADSTTMNTSDAKRGDDRDRDQQRITKQIHESGENDDDREKRQRSRDCLMNP